MPPEIQHMVETRFSVELGRRADGFTRAWCAERLRLLRRFCLPSIAAQSSDRFTWLVLCDESTDRQGMAELREEERRLPALRIELTSIDRPPRSVVRSLVRPSADVLITTQLDSDDLIADAYLEAVQSYAAAFHRSSHRDLLVNYPRGYRLDLESMGLYEERLANSSFHSLLERPRAAPVETVLRANHAVLRQYHFTHQDESMHAWAIVVHGGNLANRIRPSSPLKGTADAGIPGFSFGRGPVSDQGTSR